MAEGLGYLGDKRAVGELLEALIVSNPEKEGSYNQQNYKLYGLMIKEIEMNPDSEKIFKPEERPKEVRKEYSDIYVQWNVIKSLGLLKDVRALEPLMKAFETRFSTRSIGNEVILALKNIIKAIGETTDTKEIKLLMTFYFRKYTLPDTYYVKTELYELGNKALVKIARANIQSKEKDNIIKFLKSDDPGMVMMGASMLKGILEE